MKKDEDVYDNEDIKWSKYYAIGATTTSQCLMGQMRTIRGLVKVTSALKKKGNMRRLLWAVYRNDAERLRRWKMGTDMKITIAIGWAILAIVQLRGY